MKNSFDEFATFAPKFAQKITNALCLLDFLYNSTKCPNLSQFA